MHRRGCAARLLLACSLGVLLSAPIAAQVGRGGIAGEVTDQAGAAVQGATVTATAMATGGSRIVVSSDEGRYALVGLSPGAYRLRVELAGFRTLVREGLQVATGETSRLDLQLEVGGVEEALTVVAAAPLLRGDTAGLGHVIDNRRVVDLPLNGRSSLPSRVSLLA